MKIRKLAAVMSAISVIPLTIVITGSTAGEFFTAAAELTRRTAYISAGVPLPDSGTGSTISDISSPSEGQPPEGTSEDISQPDTSLPESNLPEGQPSESTTSATEESSDPSEPSQTSEPNSPTAPSAPSEESPARVISQNIPEFDDGLDYSAAGNNSGDIVRLTYGKYTTGDYITLASGAQVRNCTTDSNSALLAASGELPSLRIQTDVPEPQVLIVHTHTTESYEPYERDYYDEEFPFRTRDSSHNMTAVGAVLAQILADNGISVLHDGTVHDYPAYTGAYDRSEATIRAALEQYPSIKIVIDLHRDAISSADGSRTAPVAMINGKNAAQLMIIAGCDDGRFNMPNYMENFRLAALLQNSTELKYPGLARAVLFDYRNYNQHITTGSLLIEVGTHANSLDEALYTAQLLGESMAAALKLLQDE